MLTALKIATTYLGLLLFIYNIHVVSFM